jgi:hypothetical protein
MTKRPCKRCSKEFVEHLPYFEFRYFFCPGQHDEPPEVMDYYIPCENLQYLEYLSDKKGE